MGHCAQVLAWWLPQLTLSGVCCNPPENQEFKHDFIILDVNFRTLLFPLLTPGVDLLDADAVPAAVVRPGEVKVFEAEGEVVSDGTHDAVLAVQVGGVGRGVTRRRHLRDGFAAHEYGAAAGC